MWLPDIVSFGDANGYAIRPIIHDGCDVQTWTSGTCKAWYDWAVKEIRSIHPAVVLEATRFNVLTGGGAPAAVSNNLTNFATRIRSAAKNLVVLGDDPGQTQQPVDCLSHPHAKMIDCSLTLPATEASLFAEVEATADAVGAYLDTLPWFCSGGVCPMVIGHTVAYEDDNHITTVYVQELGPLFNAAMKRLIASGAARIRHT
jgi:hypothetical protein